MWYCILGPSGVGKSSISQKLGVHEIVSTTTRTPRDGEINGVHYHFVSREEFETLDLVERTEYSGNLYGFQRKDIDAAKDGRPHLMVMDIQGVFTIRRLYVDRLKVIYVTATAKKLVSNMRKRGDSDANIIDRLITTIDTNELENARFADIIIQGENVDDLVAKVNQYIHDTESSKCRQ